MNQKNKIKEFHCECCNFTTKKPSDWNRHTNSDKHARNGQKKIHKCTDCEHTTHSAWNMKMHKLSKHSTKQEREKQKYYCSICDVVFMSPLFLKSHLGGIHHKNYAKAIESLNKLKQK